MIEKTKEFKEKFEAFRKELLENLNKEMKKLGMRGGDIK